MSKVKINVESLLGEVRKALNETRNITAESMRKAIDRTAKGTVSKIRGKAPVKTREYAAGWSSKTEKVRSGRYTRTVYQKKKPGLSHLLQNGHGGPQPAPAHPHIPSDEETEKLLEKNLESEMRKG